MELNSPVLILVLLEYALKVCDASEIENTFFTVLILVLLEYALKVVRDEGGNIIGCRVLILVLLEYALKELILMEEMGSLKMS